MMRLSLIVGLALTLTVCTQSTSSIAEEAKQSAQPSLSEIQAKIELQECKFNYAALVQEKAKLEYDALTAQKKALEPKKEAEKK